MKRKMKFVAVLMACVVVFSSFTVFTASAASVAYSVTSASGKKGDTVTVSVKLSSDTSLWGANVMLEYNSSELQVVECTKGDLASTSNLYNTGSSVNYSGLFAKKSGTVFVVKFKILKSSGTSTLKLSSTENIDSSGKEYACTVTQGKITIVSSSAVAGDANEDGKITAVDARLVLQYVAGINPLSPTQLACIDMNDDGKVTAVDARIILQKVAGLK